MRQAFFLLVAVLLVLGLVGGGIFVFLRAIYTVYSDWQLARDGRQVREEAERLRHHRRQGADTRLNNGCEHHWGGLIANFPPDACSKCGLQREAPAGACDHVWRVRLDAVPVCYCEKCDKIYRPTG